ncbi:Fic family protein [Mesoterricola sediminis]|uniref:Fic family protein n=1 Tax=Mesoterricola sediminis TaxID=2927980 RepID=UPI0037449814
MVRAGLTHPGLVTLYPFEDGNGRIARALTDLALAQAPPAAPLAPMSKRVLQVRSSHDAALEQAQAFQNGLNATPSQRGSSSRSPRPSPSPNASSRSP